LDLFDWARWSLQWLLFWSMGEINNLCLGGGCGRRKRNNLFWIQLFKSPMPPIMPHKNASLFCISALPPGITNWVQADYPAPTRPFLSIVCFDLKLRCKQGNGLFGLAAWMIGLSSIAVTHLWFDRPLLWSSWSIEWFPEPPDLYLAIVSLNALFVTDAKYTHGDYYHSIHLLVSTSIEG